MNNVKKFYEALASDKALQEKVNALAAKYKDAKAEEKAVQADIIALAKTGGFDFGPEDLAAYLKQEQPLSDDEIENVAGGMMPGMSYDVGAMQLYALQRVYMEKDPDFRGGDLFMGDDGKRKKKKK